MRPRDLDERLVPAAAVRARHAVICGGALKDRVISWYRQLDPQALDERFASRGPLAKMRDLPVVSLAAVLALAVAGAGLAAKRESDRAHRVEGLAPGIQVGASTVLGPAVGASVAGYLDDAAGSLTRAVQTSADKTRIALVTFTGYRTPADTRAVLSGYLTSRLYVRARAAGGLATPLPVEVKGDLMTQLRTSFADLAKTKLAAQKAYLGYVETLKANSSQDQQFRELYESFARSSGTEAREYGNGCACVYSAVVAATPAQLLSLTARRGVRAVEVAPAGVVLSGIQVQPLLPEVTTTVPKPSLGTRR